jgi:Tol biopolymer transport system component
MSVFAQRSRLAALVAACLVVLLVLAAVALGLRLPGLGFLNGPVDRTRLDYQSRFVGRYVPLRDGFVDARLGGSTRGSSSVGGSIAAARPSSGVTTLKRVTVTHELTNDERADALRIPSVPFTARTDTRRATREPGETSACGPLRGGTVWYRYTPPVDVDLIANTFGSNYATAVGVFAGAKPASIGCDTDVRGNAIVQFRAQAGTTYFFQIEGPAGGDLVFNLDPDGVTTLDSVSREGEPSNKSARRPSLSGDGRFVAFESEATNLVRGDDNGVGDVFVRDRVSSTTTIASVSSSGEQGNGWSGASFMSGDGRYVAFESYATNLVHGDDNGALDVFVHDLLTRRTERVSVSSSGEQAREDLQNERSDTGVDEMMFASMSRDGRYVAFQSRASNLVPRDGNRTWDVFVHDRTKRVTERVSVSSSGVERGPDSPGAPNDEWMTPSISGNGRFVSFRTSAGNLVEGDDDLWVNTFVHDRLKHSTQRINGGTTQQEVRATQALSFDGRFVAFTANPPGSAEQIAFVHDRGTGRTVRVNVSSSGKRAEDGSITHNASISSDGRYVSFHSNASNLVPGDDNENMDVFVHDLKTRTTVRVANRTGPTTATGRAICQNSPSRTCGWSLPSISAQGTVVAFESTVLLPAVGGTTTDQSQVYVNERAAPVG